MIELKIEEDLKKAMLAKDSSLVNALRNIKVAILNEKIKNGSRGQSLSDEDVIILLNKEVKKRQESAELYLQGGSKSRSDAELYEKEIIEGYLPPKISEEELDELIIQEIKTLGDDKKNFGTIIKNIKLKTSGRADGSIIAQKVQQKLNR